MNNEDEDRFPSSAAARAGIDALRQRANRLSASASAIAMQVSMLCQHFATTLDAIERGGEALPAELAASSTAIEVFLTRQDFDTTEAVISRLQELNPRNTIDACIQEIFITGLAAMAHRIGAHNQPFMQS